MTNEISYARKLQAQYTEREVTKLDRLKELDKKVKRPIQIFSYIFGSITALLMGAGMSLIMTEISSFIGLTGNLNMVLGVVLGVIGMGLAVLNYPLHNKMMRARKKKYANEVIALSNELLNK